MGTLRSAYPVFRLTVLPEGDGGAAPAFQKISGRDGHAELPAGRYTVFNWEIETTDKDGRKWSAAGNMLPGPLEVRASAETRLPLATPLQAHVYTILESREIVFRMNYTGSEGERVREIKVDGVLAPPQRLKIVDAAGKVAQTLPFQAGCCGTGLLNWNPPETLRGRFWAVPEVKLGPFAVEVGAGMVFDLADGRMRMPEPKVGNPAPDFSLIGADAATVQLSFLRRRPVVLCFLSGSDESQAVAAALARRPEVAGRAHLVAVFTDPELTSLTATEHFRTTTGFPGPVLLDQILGATLEYHAAECPRVWVISSAGVIVYTNRDAAAAPKVVADEVAAALGSMPGTSK